MYNSYAFTANLVAFMEKQDLPPSLYPFVRSACLNNHTSVRRDDRVMIFKIEGTINSYHAVIIKNNVNVGEVEDGIVKDLSGIVELSGETRDILQKLLDGFHRGEFAYFLRYHAPLGNTRKDNVKRRSKAAL
jgi:hypothetical protein